MSMMLDSVFADRSEFARGGVKRMMLGGAGGCPSNFYQELEVNAERLLVSFPSKDKIQLMKLLEELDNRVEVAHDILNSELIQTRNVLEETGRISSIQQQQSEQQEERNNPQSQRRVLMNLKPKINRKNNNNNISKMQSSQQAEQQGQEDQSSSSQGRFMQQQVSTGQLSLNNNQQELNQKQELSGFSQNTLNKHQQGQESEFENANKQQTEQFQPSSSFSQTQSIINVNQQQMQPPPAPLRRLKDFPSINQFQKNLMEQIVPALINNLGNSSIQQAPQMIYEALKYYEEENRKAVQFEKIISSHDILLKAFANQYSKIQRFEKANAELIQENESLTAERDKYKNLSQRLAIMFNTTNNYSISDHIDKPPYNGGSGPGAFCF